MNLIFINKKVKKVFLNGYAKAEERRKRALEQLEEESFNISRDVNGTAEHNNRVDGEGHNSGRASRK